MTASGWPRFLVESGTYQVDNIGDIAMLQVTVDRITERFPDARVAVVTEQPERLKHVLPRAVPVAASSWFRQPIVPVPGFAKYWKTVSRVRWWERRLGGSWPRLANLGKQWHARRDPNAEPGEARRYFEELRNADAVICSGGGFLNDFYHEHAFKILTTLHAAQGLGKPTALFGVGLGPWTRHDLREIAEPVLRGVDVVSMRDRQSSRDVMSRAKLNKDRCHFTGDDAVRLAVEAGPGEVASSGRNGLGVNVRLSADAEVDRDLVPRLGQSLRELSDELAMPLVPLVIRTADSPINDVDSARLLLGDGVDLSQARDVRKPADALAAVARCGVVVTGAYHNAVFALTMGIPVVALAGSAYYHAKMSGVAEMFGGGIRVLDYNDDNLLANLRSAVLEFRRDAEALSPQLRERGREQIAKADAAYARFFEQVANLQAKGNRR